MSENFKPSNNYEDIYDMDCPVKDIEWSKCKKI